MPGGASRFVMLGSLAFTLTCVRFAHTSSSIEGEE